jgi:endo-beta-N-acetylglucosaminidase D
MDAISVATTFSEQWTHFHIPNIYTRFGFGLLVVGSQQPIHTLLQVGEVSLQLRNHKHRKQFVFSNGLDKIKICITPEMGWGKLLRFNLLLEEKSLILSCFDSRGKMLLKSSLESLLGSFDTPISISSSLPGVLLGIWIGEEKRVPECWIPESSDVPMLSSSPLRELDELESWMPGFDPLNRETRQDRKWLESVQFRNRNRLHTLSCHDMMGGYTEDSRCLGIDRFNAYSFRHWRLIDLFVYFSHHLVTIPPISWILCAHNHQVPILGTLITEWDQGKAINKQLLQKPIFFARQLDLLRKYYGFDGWLLNFEADIEEEDLPALKLFISELVNLSRTSNHNAIVLWYDSIDSDSGSVQWQSCLNEKNLEFFDLCDGILTDYKWKKGFPQESSKLAGSRHFDVFMGIDVFGRGTFEGGGYNSHSAIQVVEEAHVSFGLFAPAWTYENFGAHDTSRFRFEINDSRLWLGESFSANILGEFPHKLDLWTLNAPENPNPFNVNQFSTEFVCGFRWNEKSRKFPLTEYSREFLDSAPIIVCLEDFVGTGPEANDQYFLRIELLDESDNVLSCFDSGIKEASNSIQTIAHEFSAYGIGLHALRWTHGGQDVEGWQGHYGCRVFNSFCVFVLPRTIHSPDHVARRPNAIQRIPFELGFSSGAGTFTAVSGEKVLETSWSNPIFQDASLPLFILNHKSSCHKNGIYGRLSYEDAFLHGSCLEFVVSNPLLKECKAMFQLNKFSLNQENCMTLKIGLSFKACTCWSLTLGIEFVSGIAFETQPFHNKDLESLSSWKLESAEMKLDCEPSLAVLFIKPACSASSSCSQHFCRIGHVSLEEASGQESPSIINLDYALSWTSPFLNKGRLGGNVFLTWQTSFPLSNPLFSISVDGSFFGFSQNPCYLIQDLDLERNHILQVSLIRPYSGSIASSIVEIQASERRRLPEWQTSYCT